MKRTSTPAEPAEKVRKPRGRPRSFDRESALDAAMEVFWARGFEGAAISDLTKAMGINPPSLYAAFGDKEHLFIEAINRYQSKRGESCPYCEEATAKEAIERLLTYMAHELSESCNPRGCMMMMAAATSGNSSKKLQAMLAAQRMANRDRLKDRIKKGLQDGDVPAGTDAGALADFYSTILTGMSALARDGTTRKALMATVAQAMSLFPEAPRRAKKAARRESAAVAGD
jgi:AcrR family transcriptional regulator